MPLKPGTIFDGARKICLTLSLLLAFQLIALWQTAESTYAAAPTGIVQQINIIDQTFSTTNGSASPADNRLGLVYWDEDMFSGASVYFEAVIRCASCTGGNGEMSATLYTEGGSAISQSAITTDSSDFVRVISGEITSNLTDDTAYSVKIFRDATAGTAVIQAARLIIVQSGSLTATQGQIEIGNSDTTTSSSYELLTSQKIFKWEPLYFSDTQSVAFEATLQGSGSGETMYAALSSDGSCSSTVSGSEVSITGDSWGLARSNDIKANLTNNSEYWVCVKSTSGTGTIASAKLIVTQADVTGINRTQLYHQYLNTVASDSDSTYTSQNYPNLYDPDLITAEVVKVFHEATISTSGGTGYARLFNVTDTVLVNNSEVTTTGITYSLQRSGDLLAVMPGAAKVLDVQLKNSATNTTVATNSWLIIRLEEYPMLSFTLAGVAADTLTNGITTTMASAVDELDFGFLTYGQPKYLAHQLTVVTNASEGYEVTVRLINYVQGGYPANNIDPFPATWGSPQTWYEPDGTTANQNTGWIGANTSDTRVTGWSDGSGKFGPLDNVSRLVMYSSTLDDGSSHYVTYAMEVNNHQPTDLYVGGLQYSVLPIY